MPYTTVNFIAVLVAAVANMILGSLWYSPNLFGKKWMDAMKLTEKDMQKTKEKGMGKVYAKTFVMSLLTAYVLALIIKATGVSRWTDGLLLGAFIWLGFVFTKGVNDVLWEQKNTTVFRISMKYQLISLLMMGTILAVWK